jgi:hypothetical protein
MTNAPSDSTVANTAFVSGFRRWYGDGAGGASAARKVASSAASVATPPGLAESIP